MQSIVLSTATRYLFALLLLFSIFVLFRGHNEPGGGFVGGLVAASAFALYALAEGVAAARRALRYSPRIFIAGGLAVALGSALVSVVLGYEFMEGVWGERTLPGVKLLGTPLFFDIGVYLVVFGTVVGIIFNFFTGDDA